MAWLLREGEVLASVEQDAAPIVCAPKVASSDEQCAVLLSGIRAVHTIGLREPLDIAYLNAALEVLETTRMAPYRFGRPRLRAQLVLGARAGAFERWRLRPGDTLEIKG